MTRIRLIDRIARAVDRSTARESSERNEKQDQDTIQDNQTLLCLFTVQKTHQAAPRDSWRSRTATLMRFYRAASRWKQCRTTCLRNPFTHSCQSPTPFGCTMASINSLIRWDKLGASLKRWNVACKARFAVLRQLQCVQHMHTTHRVRVQHHAQWQRNGNFFRTRKSCAHTHVPVA